MAEPIDPKRDEYRRYLERGGIIESLTKVFVRILKDRPEDPTQYLLQSLGDARLQADNIAHLQSELEDARMEIQRLTDIIRNINPDLLNESNNKVLYHEETSHDSKSPNDSQGQDHAVSALSNQHLQREEYTPIGGIDDEVRPEANATLGHVNND